MSRSLTSSQRWLSGKQLILPHRRRPGPGEAGSPELHAAFPGSRGSLQVSGLQDPPHPPPPSDKCSKQHQSTTDSVTLRWAKEAGKGLGGSSLKQPVSAADSNQRAFTQPLLCA